MTQHRKIVGTAEAGRAGTDYGDLVTIPEELFGNIAVFFFQLLSCNELFDLIDGYRLIKVSTGTYLLTESCADISANSRERIFLFDELKGFPELAFTGFFQIALNCYMRRTVGLARCGSGLRDHILPVGQKVRLPVLGSKYNLIIRDLCLFNLNRSFLAKLCSKLNRILRTYFHAAAAGNTIRWVDLGNIIGSHETRRLGIPACLQCHTGIPLAVADKERKVRAVNIGQLMH